jgi:hypothetical protein
MKKSDAEIERAVLKLVDDHLPEKQRDAAREWLKARITSFKSIERLG